MKRKLKYRNKTRYVPQSVHYPILIMDRERIGNPSKYYHCKRWDSAYELAAFPLIFVMTYMYASHRRSRVNGTFYKISHYSYREWNRICKGREFVQGMLKQNTIILEVKLHEKETQVQE